MMGGDGDRFPRNREGDGNEEILVWGDACITDGGRLGLVFAGWWCVVSWSLNVGSGGTLDPVGRFGNGGL